MQQAVTRMRAAGVVIQAEGNRLTVVSRAPLTDAQRQFIRAHKADLLRVVSPPPSLSSEDEDAIQEAIEERAAIREFDGGESREVAEQAARSAMRVYRVLARMPDERPPRWMTMIAPGCDLPEARRSAEQKFGADRIITIEESAYKS